MNLLENTVLVFKANDMWIVLLAILTEFSGSKLWPGELLPTHFPYHFVAQDWVLASLVIIIISSATTLQTSDLKKKSRAAESSQHVGGRIRSLGQGKDSKRSMKQFCSSVVSKHFIPNH